MSNGNAAAGLLVTVAILTGMSHVTPGRRHAVTHHWSSPERVELGDARLPVSSVRTVQTHASYDARDRSRPRIVHRETTWGKSAEPPEVIVGYVDPRRGPRAFHRLTKVTEGDRVKVVRHDHSVAWFKVDSVRRALRRSIERERSSTGRPELRLISLRDKKEQKNDPRDVVVSAHLDRPETPETPPG
ncbi:class F sortase [Actinomadura sp. DC4]|uniref:class F sortase n=1 Tax=Actinomadura sp. DC4 TaxID=3055069 RepID=UPI0025B1E876|nr:class F sortase [Actinomadura sp. DC4]MDN3357360.1 class F sortase [Actinomadura sp. DC4]